jgi:hypothetical protein
MKRIIAAVLISGLLAGCSSIPVNKTIQGDAAGGAIMGAIIGGIVGGPVGIAIGVPVGLAAGGGVGYAVVKDPALK